MGRAVDSDVFHLVRLGQVVQALYTCKEYLLGSVILTID